MQKRHGMWPSLMVGFIAGAAAGIVANGMTSERSKRKIKRHAEHAMRTMSDFARDLTDMGK